jgi:ribulose-5-phosphate 4-epimerase/fuculose-1-phosphate aldolase
MPEEHIGTKFHTEFLSGKVDDLLAAELVHWCRTFDHLGLAPDYGRGSCGNLSYRVGGGFIITPTGAYFSSIQECDLVSVIACDFENKRVTVVGDREPSSETMLHYEIYQRREDVKAVFHGHGEEIVRHAQELEYPKPCKSSPTAALS